MKHFSKIMAAIIIALALTPFFANRVPLAQAAVTTIYVNDGTFNDPTVTFCPATPYITIQAGINAAMAPVGKNGVVIVCQGTYTEQPSYTGSVLYTHILVLKAKGNVDVRPPLNAFGPVFDIEYMKAATVTGFHINGLQRQDPASVFGNGVFFQNVKAGMISLNTISQIGDNYADANAEHAGITVYGTNVFDAAGNFLPFKVTITKNSIAYPKYRGIVVRGNVKPIISSNVVRMSGTGVPVPYGTVGIFLENYRGRDAAAFCPALSTTPCKPIGGSILKNTIYGDYNAVSGSYMTGIEVYDSSNDVVQANKIHGMGLGIIVRDEYSTVNSFNGTAFDTMDNKVIGNSGTVLSFAVALVGQRNTNSAAAPWVFRNTISSNKFFEPTGQGSYGILVNHEDTNPPCVSLPTPCSLFVDFDGKKNTVSYNTMLGYAVPYYFFPALTAVSNKSGPPPAGQSPSEPQPDMPLLPEYYAAPMVFEGPAAQQAQELWDAAQAANAGWQAVRHP